MPRRASIKAKVARRVGDVVVVITEVIGEEDTNRLPAVGDTVRPRFMCLLLFYFPKITQLYLQTFVILPSCFSQISIYVLCTCMIQGTTCISMC